MIRTRHTHGITETHATIEEALAALRSIYGKDTVVYAGGDHLTDEEQLRTGRALVWQDEASATDDDDGVRAVATVSATVE